MNFKVSKPTTSFANSNHLGVKTQFTSGVAKKAAPCPWQGGGVQRQWKKRIGANKLRACGEPAGKGGN